MLQKQLSKLNITQFKMFYAAFVHYWVNYKFFISKQNFYNLWCELNLLCHEMDESFPDQYDDREAVKDFCHFHPYYFIDRLPQLGALQSLLEYQCDYPRTQQIVLPPNQEAGGQ